MQSAGACARSGETLSGLAMVHIQTCSSSGLVSCMRHLRLDFVHGLGGLANCMLHSWVTEVRRALCSALRGHGWRYLRVPWVKATAGPRHVAGCLRVEGAGQGAHLRVQRHRAGAVASSRLLLQGAVSRRHPALVMASRCASPGPWADRPQVGWLLCAPPRSTGVQPPMTVRT